MSDVGKYVKEVVQVCVFAVAGARIVWMNLPGRSRASSSSSSSRGSGGADARAGAREARE